MPGPCANPKDALKVDVLGDANAATIRVSGALAEQCGAFIKKISLLSADAFFAGIFRSSFVRQGGKIAGQIREGKAASNAKFFTSIDSDSLMEILRTTNKNSNNLMAQQLFLTIGAELTGKPPTFSSSAAALQRWIGERIPETVSFVLENGSGLSDNERVTAKGMVALLDHIRTSRYAAQFLDTLPAVGEDGTMKNRLRDDPVAGRSVAKTGTLRDTRAIAGVLFSKNGHTYTFAMIVNDRHAAASRDTIDKLIAWLHGLGDRGR